MSEQDEVPELNLAWLNGRTGSSAAASNEAEASPSSGPLPRDGAGAQPSSGEGPPPSSPAFEVENPSLGSDLAEIIQLGAVDPLFFNQVWFPKTFRQAPALFHPVMYHSLDDPTKRYINFQVFRDGAKTTILRGYSARRISYGISRTILYIGANETKAKQSVAWMKHQIETNPRWAETFKLRKSKPWSDEQICILHGVEEHPINMLGFGITGGFRGINLDDYRPDLIILDDVISDENAANEAQREKIINLALGAVKYSLARRSEVPDAKLVILNTPLDFADLSEMAKKDPQFYSASFGCWTEETKGLGIDEQESSWPAAFPSEELRAEKRASIARNRYSIFAREKECNLIIPEDHAFRAEWLNYFGDPGDEYQNPPLDETWVEMAIDPVPPPTDKQLQEGLKKKDYESIAVVGRWQGKYFLLDQMRNRGHNPTWTVQTVFDLARRWRVRKILVEAVAYQKVLEWILREAMRKTGRYWLVEPFVDKRKKYNRIIDGIQAIAGEGALYVRRSQAAFISQYIHFGGLNPDGQLDDDIESVAVALLSLSKGFVGDVADDWMYEQHEAHLPELPDYRGAP